MTKDKSGQAQWPRKVQNWTIKDQGTKIRNVKCQIGREQKNEGTGTFFKTSEMIDLSKFYLASGHIGNFSDAG